MEDIVERWKHQWKGGSNLGNKSNRGKVEATEERWKQQGKVEATGEDGSKSGGWKQQGKG